MRVSHLSLDFSLWSQCRYRINYDHIYSRRAHQHIDNLKCLFARVRLGNKQFFYIHPEFSRVSGIQRMFGVDKRARAPQFLRFGHNGQRQSCLSG